MSEPIIRFNDVCKSFGPLQVLKDLSLQVQPREHVALIGPSGSGKTTILRILMTLENIQGGTVQVEGEQLWHEEKDGELQPAGEAHLRRMRRSIGMVFQQFNLFPHLTVIRNVADPPRLALGIAKDEANRRALELLEMVGLTDKVDQYPAQLSGGQMQRVAIARALNMSPKIMLFDEVTSALDPELVEEVQLVLRQLAEETDMTMLFVTHEMQFAHEVADRVLFFDGGQIVEEGPPDQIFTNPRQERTQAFLRKIVAAGIAL